MCSQPSEKHLVSLASLNPHRAYLGGQELGLASFHGGGTWTSKRKISNLASLAELMRPNHTPAEEGGRKWKGDEAVILEGSLGRPKVELV